MQGLHQSYVVANRFLSLLDKVQATVNLISSVQQAFNIASSVITGVTVLTNAPLDTQRFNVADFAENALVALGENMGRIGAGIIQYKLSPSPGGELSKVAGLLKHEDTKFEIYGPSILGLQLPTLPLGIKIGNRDAVLASIGGGRKNFGRLFGVGIGRSGNSGISRNQLFRMDYVGNHQEGSNDPNNHTVWYDSTREFHFHIPKS